MYDGLALPGNNYLNPLVWGRESVDLPVSRGVALIFLVVGVAWATPLGVVSQSLGT